MSIAVLGTLTLVPCREDQPAFTRVVTYERRRMGDSWVVPVITERTVVDGRLRTTRITERPLRRGNRRDREWPRPGDLPDAPEPTWLKEARLDALTRAGQITCGTCGLARRAYDGGVEACSCPHDVKCKCGACPVDIGPSDDDYGPGEDAADGFDDGALDGPGGLDGRNAA